jgi:hypothetical protein
MGEEITEEKSELEYKRDEEPIGPVKIGDVNPMGLSIEEFNKTPSLLFHASAHSLHFNQNAKVTDFDNPVGATLGNGFYTTPSLEEAELYKKAREGFGRNPVVSEVLPYQAYMYDLRLKSDLFRNADVPAELVKAWKDYYQNDFKNQFPQMPDLTPPLNENASQYLLRQKYLNRLQLLSGSKPVELRSLLSVSSDNFDGGGAGPFFSNFMQEQGYDGVIYIEGGDHPDQKNPVTYVFYNYQKVGTYDAWNKKDTHS